MNFDTSLFFALNNLAGRSYGTDLLIVFFAQYFAYIATIIFLITAYRSRNRFAALWLPLISALIARAGITELIRFFYHRPRPFTAFQVHQLLSDSAWSFPSGHAAFFFALATGVWLYDKKWGTALFLVAAVITTSRVIAGVHYPSDILAGALLGIATAYATSYVLKFVRKN
ncbi:MAG: phosphatase PAP2 family protein [Candidatus Sungbacteria bacterium]|nr:phosphatase PAP2 family protein [Candidatus Sungbacteria bacterium]